ncbi:hypothetical protein, partial [Anaerotignum lactatifermentans]|uniref:hypothetical protein n=1 Tax=Anaerotignum lactatifermentans TaxID=160404 RepID=UPI003AB1D5DF
PRWILFHSFFSGHSETPLCSSIILHKGAFCHCPFLLDLFKSLWLFLCVKKYIFYVFSVNLAEKYAGEEVNRQREKQIGMGLETYKTF